MRSIVLKLSPFLLHFFNLKNVLSNAKTTANLNSLQNSNEENDDYVYYGQVRNYQPRSIEDSNPCTPTTCPNPKICHFPPTSYFPLPTIPYVELEQICTDAGDLEVVFLVDGSGSVGSDNFAIQIEFIEQMVSGMDIGADATRVGMMQYSNVFDVEFDLLDDKSEILTALGGVEYMKGGTKTGEAIKKCYNKIIKGETRQDSTVIMIVVTDGKNKDDVLEQESDRMRSYGIVMFSVGWAGAVLSELEIIANEPASEHVFVGTTSADLLEMTNELTSAVCVSVPYDGEPFDYSNHYSCDCPYSYSGDNCETFVPPCDYEVEVLNNETPCLNGGTCNDIGDTGYSCTCLEGFTHEICQTPIPCFHVSPDPCVKLNERCTNDEFFANYECECDLGWITTVPGYCNTYFPCEDPLFAPCKNGAQCTNGIPIDGIYGYNCICTAGFTGENCDLPIPCFQNTCSDHGNCVDVEEYSSYTCNCDLFYGGVDCEIATPCLAVICQNSGTCQNTLNLQSYTCVCTTGFTGPHCETPAQCADQQTTSLPCLNGATCIDSENLADYTCICEPGFTGTDCQTPAPCNDQITTNLPCLNGGDCINSADLSSYTCSCLIGEFAGDHCEIPAPCAQQLIDSVPCLNGGTCLDQPDLLDYTCTCAAGFTGKDCEIPAQCNDQASLQVPCKNGATCLDDADLDGYTCTCADGFTLTPTDQNCETPIPCFGDNNPCENSAQCLNSGNFDSYTCICNAGTISLTAELICETVVPCSLLPCQNEATCTDFGDMSDYQCTCVGDFAGKNCELPIPCLSGPNAGGNPCFNGGVCTNDDDFLGETCECSSTGFSGTHCDNSVPCFSTPCQHGGACTDVADINGDLSDYTCVCEPGFTGNDCETPAECADQTATGLPCQNGGSCADFVDLSDYTCTCAAGFTGDDCEIPAQCNDQASLQVPCQNGGTCTDSADLASYTCACVADFTGADCEIPGKCNDQTTLQVPCQNGGTCTDSLDLASYTCTCAEGFTGDDCQIGAKCNNQETCQNGGTCTDSPDLTSYTCACLPGFTDSNCKTSIPCFSSPCVNGGTCTDTLDFRNYICECLAEFTNTNCQDDLDSCGSSPCLNGGTCADLDTGYSCTCSTSFTDNNCQTPIPCEVNGVAPCGDGGVCVNTENYSDFTCQCDGYHEGEFCQTEIIFPPGKDTNPTEIVDPFPCLWTDPFCIIYLHAGIVIQAYDIPDVNFLSEDDFCDDDDLCDQRCEDFNPEWCAETCVECGGVMQEKSSRKRRQLAGPPSNSALDVLENYGCWCSKMFTGFALMGEVLDETDTLCREFSRCWRCIGMMECEGDLADPYVLTFIPNSDNYTCTSDSKCAEQRCLCTAKASVDMARHMIERNSSLIAENYNVDPSLCVRGDGSVFNDQCCGDVPEWIPYNGLTQACVEGITREGEDGWIVIEV